MLTAGQRSAFDISHILPDPFPSGNISTYFNQRWIQEALGVPLNFSAFSNAVSETWFAGPLATGDAASGNISNLKYLLANGVKVVMIYGDRDYRCNCEQDNDVSQRLSSDIDMGLQGLELKMSASA